MRTTYRKQLDDVLEDLVSLSDIVAVAVRKSTRALLEANIKLAEEVIAGDETVDAAKTELEQQLFSLLARQAPVASELRLVVASLRMVSELERMGDLAAHVAKVARLRYPEPAVPAALLPNFTRMGEVAESMVVRAGQTLSQSNVDAAEELRRQDEEMDDLRRSQFKVMLGPEWPHGVESAVDVALLGRYYERISDHAASLASRVVYIVTGEFPEDDDWPQPVGGSS